jgi:hypothetical protein
VVHEEHDSYDIFVAYTSLAGHQGCSLLYISKKSSKIIGFVGTQND